MSMNDYAKCSLPQRFISCRTTKTNFLIGLCSTVLALLISGVVMPAYADPLIVTSGGITASAMGAAISVQGNNFSLSGGTEVNTSVGQEGLAGTIATLYIPLGMYVSGNFLGMQYPGPCFNSAFDCPGLSGTGIGIVASFTLPTIEVASITVTFPVDVSLIVFDRTLGTYPLLASGMASVNLSGHACTIGGPGFCYTQLSLLRVTFSQPVPEPSTWLLFASGLAVMGLWQWRRKLDKAA
jgi:hypothetical protein